MSSSKSTDDFQVLRLKASYESFGVLVEFLAGVEPFSRYDLGNFALALLRQLREGEHLAALTANRMVGYCGWLSTREEQAEAWTKNAGGIGPLAPGEVADAVVLTVVAAQDPRIVKALVREARRLNPSRRVYFKRDYADGGKAARKRSVRNTTAGGAV